MIYVLSLDRPDKPATDEQYYNVIARLKEFGFKVSRAEGSYQGIIERSIIARWDGPDHTAPNELESLARGFDQDAIVMSENPDKPIYGIYERLKTIWLVDGQR